jgi:hypothetical protein
MGRMGDGERMEEEDEGRGGGGEGGLGMREVGWMRGTLGEGDKVTTPFFLLTRQKIVHFIM